MDIEPTSAQCELGKSGLSEDEVRQALDRITGRPPLSRSQRLSAFLRYIVEETLAGRAERISGYAIAIDVFKRPESFDPSSDSLVRVEAGRLRRRLAEYYYEEGAEDPIEISLPKGSYIPTFKTRSARRVRDAAPTGTAHRGPSIAVLPFHDYSGNPDDRFFADGLTEETTANLARFKDLFVFARSTTARLAREGADVRQLHLELGVDLVLESSLRKSDDRVRVTVQLIDAATEGQIFSKRFERPSTQRGIFEIQDEIARLIAGHIADRYGPIGRYAARAPRAGRSSRWETYLWIIRFYENYAKHLPDLHLEVRDGLEAALASDPESSDGWAALAAVYLDEYRLHLNERSDFPALDRALEAALRGVACDPDNAMAYQFLATTYFHRHERADFELAAQKALELNPGHADALADIGFCYAASGHWERGLELIERALELSPVHPGWYHVPPALRKLLNDDPEAALLEMKQSPMPGFYWYHALMACFFAWAGRDSEAADEVGELLEVFPDFAAEARREPRIWMDDEALIEKLLEGWRKAGLPVA